MSWKLKEKIDSVLSKEQGTVYKDPGGKINIALVYPNTYHVGMSNLGFQGIYGLLNKMDDVLCERVFLPDDEDMEEFLRTDTELFAMESKRTLSRFDIIAFSVSFENDYPNIVKILTLSRIPLRSSERNSTYPLVILGGACAFFNPEPVADFFDIVFIGEAEELLPEFLDAYRHSAERPDILKRSVAIEGLYVPQFYSAYYDNEGKISGRYSSEGAPEIVKRRYLTDITKSDIKTSIITPETEFSSMYLIEAMRGCPWSCRFCVAGHIYNPFRKKALQALEKEIATALSKTKRIGIIGPSLSDYPGIKEVLKIPEVDFSITSLRASPKSAELVGLLKGHKSISIAPEAGTERLRRVINKKITEEDILRTADLILSEGIATLKLYFMVGLPTETREDITGIVNLVKKIKNIIPKGNLTLSISTFVPKPFTPFQWHPMEKPAEVKERLKMIKDGLLPFKGINVFHDVPKYAYMQGLFSQGDRRLSKVIEKTPECKDWRKAAATAGIKEEFYIFREKEFSEILPWDFIDIGVRKENLWTEYQEALSHH
ncbi:MAG TPA: radical SAM protein [Thermodesulfovibrionales bacterium]|nr:radical SAM protein [Thermodesulfovibrionales bacterium]